MKYCVIAGLALMAAVRLLLPGEPFWRQALVLLLLVVAIMAAISAWHEEED